MKHVVTIAELHKLIPETNVLEGKNFKDIKQLILSVIDAIEQSGSWEYVQYISGNPSLFVVKQKALVQSYSAQQYNNVEEEIKNHYDTKTQRKASNKAAPEKRIESVKEESNSFNSDSSLHNSDSLFKETTLPW